MGKNDKVIFADEQQDEQHPGGPIGLARQDSCAVRRGAEPGHFNLHQFGAYDLFENAGTRKDNKMDDSRTGRM